MHTVGNDTEALNNKSVFAPANTNKIKNSMDTHDTNEELSCMNSDKG